MAEDDKIAPTPASIALARLEVKIDGLSEKLDLKHEFVLKAIESSGREAAQKDQFLEASIRSLEESTRSSFASFGARLQDVEADIETERDWTSREKGVLAVLTVLSAGGTTALIINIVHALQH